MPRRGADTAAGRATGYGPGGRSERGRTRARFAGVRNCASGREMKSGGQGGAAGQPDRDRFDREAGRTGSAGFG